MSNASKERIYQLINMFDNDPRIPEAFNEQKVIDLALVVLEKACKMQPNRPVIQILQAALVQYLRESE